MAMQKRDNSGSLSKNKRKRTDSDPTLSGSIMVAGQEYWINGWVKTADDGDKWISLSVRPKEQQAQTTTKAIQEPAEDTEIPF